MCGTPSSRTSTWTSLTERLRVCLIGLCVSWGWYPAKDDLSDSYIPLRPRNESFSSARDRQSRGVPWAATAKTRVPGACKSNRVRNVDVMGPGARWLLGAAEGLRTWLCGHFAVH